MEVYQVRQLENDVYAITETASIHIYVILGSKEALVLDMGYGYGNLVEQIRQITDLPLRVIASHGHPDHALGAYQFSKIYIHPKDMAYLKETDTKQFRQQMLSYRLNKMPDLKGKIDEQQFLNGSLDHVQMEPIVEGDVIDIGKYQFDVIEIPGHSYGSIALLEKKQKWLFTGDTITSYNIWNNNLYPKYTPPLRILMDTYKKVDRMKGLYQKIFSAHGEIPIGHAIVIQLQECLRDLLVNYQNDEHLDTFLGPSLRHNYQGRLFLYTPELLEDALRDGIE